MDQPPAPTPPAVDDNEKLWIILCHLSLLIGVGILLPLVVYFVKKDSKPNTAAHAKEALLFHISMVLYGIVSFMLTIILIGVLGIIAVIVLSIVCSILACIKASEGQFYRYPLTIRFF